MHRNFNQIAFPILGYIISKKNKISYVHEKIIKESIIIDNEIFPHYILTLQKNINKKPVHNFITNDINNKGYIDEEDLFENKTMQNHVYELYTQIDFLNNNKSKNKSKNKSNFIFEKKIFNISTTNTIGIYNGQIKVTNVFVSEQIPKVYILNTTKNIHNKDIIAGIFEFSEK
jgi:hypothetical protein